MNRSQKDTLVGGILLAFWLTVIVGVGYGWIENVIKLFNSDFAHLTGALVLRCIGVLVVPLGAVMGFL